MPTALITGVTGQDGTILARSLLAKGYIVHGLVRRNSTYHFPRIENVIRKEDKQSKKFCTHYGDITDRSSLYKIISQVRPDEIYNLAAQSDVGLSFTMPRYTLDVNALGPVHVMDCIKDLGLTNTRFFQASTSEMFGRSIAPQTDTSPFIPMSPYGMAKLYAHNMVKLYREAYGIWACTGIMFNHESALRGQNFVTRKIARGLAKIKLGLQSELYLGNLYAVRDWGHAIDYVDAMIKIMHHHQPDDFILATGIAYRVKDFVEITAKHLNMGIRWEGKGINEVGIYQGSPIIKIDPYYFRPLEVPALVGNSNKAKKMLGWEATSSFEELIYELATTEHLNALHYLSERKAI